MSTAAIVELACIILAAICVGLLAEARAAVVSERVDRIIAQERANTYRQRAVAAERIVRDAAARFEERLGPVNVGTAWHEGFDRHADQALEVAEPTPDLRSVQP